VSARKPIVLFGTGYVTRFVHFMFEHDSPYQVVALTVDREFLPNHDVFGLPVVAFEDMPDRYPPERFSMFVALGYTLVNRLREEKCQQARAVGYELVSHVSPRASTWDDLEIGDNCLVMDQVIIHPFVTIGSNNIIWSGAHIGHGSIVTDNCFFASRALAAGGVTVEPNCFIGANATIRHGVHLGRETIIGAGAVISRDTGARSIYAAPPARLLPGTSDRLPGL
jgi:sugar O-acyltransferase (sialic acid O-acetyltransferase NeuD family)